MSRRGTRKGAAQKARPVLEFLCVDRFLRTLVEARTLKSALELGLIDELLRSSPGRTEAMAASLNLDAAGLQFLLDLLCAGGVTEQHEGTFVLSEEFRRALDYRDLLETRLDFAGFVAFDFIDSFSTALTDPGRFARDARLFRLFDYRRCFEATPENYEHTRTWMRITTVLSRYEARACMAYHDFAPHRKMLDVGGNSGEFALQVCRRHPGITATVLDLPLVCEIGAEHVLPEPERERIAFIEADMRTGDVPGGYDLITFKSMLHDWPAEEARSFLSRAYESLSPGGTLLVFERARLRPEAAAPAFSMLPHLLFFRSYREPDEYLEQLRALGCRDADVQTVPLETPFFLVAARKPV